jgi:hypothetical protein
MVSYRDPLWAEIQAGRLMWTDISPDVVHPNDRGHAYAARFVTHALDQALKKLPSKDVAASVAPMPIPVLTDLFEQVQLMEADTLKPLANDGWSYDAKSSSWKSQRPGSTIEFEIEGRAILTMHYLIRGPMGRARVTVDGRDVAQLEAWFDQTWGGCRKTQLVTRDLPGGKHRVRFELLPEKHAQSTGHEFQIMGLGGAGN